MSENSIVPVVAVNTRLAIGLAPEPTAPLKVVPPELVMVRVPMSVPMVLLTATTPVVLIVKLEALPESVPARELRLIALALPVPIVKVTLSAKVVAPKLIAPVAAPPMAVLAKTLTGVVPKLTTLLPVVAAIVPDKYFVLGANAVRPFVNVKVPPLAPRVKVPVLLKVTALVIVPVLAFRARLYAALLVFSVVAVSAPLKVIAPVVLVRVTVVAPTVPLKVVPPELVMVRVPTPDTEEPLISAPATPPVANVKL